MHSLARKNFEYPGQGRHFISLPGLMFVLVLHAAIFYFLWQQRLIPAPDQMVTLFAELITPPLSVPKPAPAPAPVKQQPAKKPETQPKPERLVTKAPVTQKQEVAEPLPPAPAPVTEPAKQPVITAAPPTPMPTEPIKLSSELSVSCPKLTPPEYPAISRRMGEEGKLVLRVELDEAGRIDTAKIISSSGYERLDNAALTAVKNWQCNPSLRNGQPVRAVALQPFNFVLQGN